MLAQPDNFSQCLQRVDLNKSHHHDIEDLQADEEDKKPVTNGVHRPVLLRTRKDFSASQRAMNKNRRRAKIKFVERQIKFKNDLILPKLRKVNSSRALRHRGPVGGVEIETAEKKRRNYCNYLLEPPVTGTLQIEITDNGCGMTKEEQDRLFHPFSQASKGTYSKYGGTGLGMWISYKLVCAMGGNIQCRSIVGEGTTFTIKIPARWRNSGRKDAELADVHIQLHREM